MLRFRWTDQDQSSVNISYCGFSTDHFIASENKLVVTSANDCPEQSQKGERIVREDMKTTHEEADVIIPQQVMYAMKEGRQIRTVRADDTDIFVLLCHFHFLVNYFLHFQTLRLLHHF